MWGPGEGDSQATKCNGGVKSSKECDYVGSTGGGGKRTKW